MIPEEYVERLQELSDKKYVLLKDILYLSKAQAQSIKDDNEEELERLVAAKQSHIDAIDKLDEEFNAYFISLKKELGIKSLDELKGRSIKGVDMLQNTIADILEIIKEISILETQNKAGVKKMFDEVSDEIRKLNQAKRVNNAYTNAPSKAPSYFIDKKK